MEEKANVDDRALDKKRKKDVILIASLGAMRYQPTTYVFDKVEKTTKYTFDAVCEVEKPNKLLLVGTVDSYWHELVDYYSKFIADDNDLVNVREVKEFVKREQVPKADAETLLKRDAYKPLLELDKSARTVAINCIRDADKRVIFEKSKRIDKDYSCVEELIKTAGGFDRVKIVIVPEGIDKEQQDEYFYCLLDGIEDLICDVGDRKAEILFDVTNGFRSMPLYIMMLIRYFDLLKSHDFEFKAYYGAFEARGKDNRTPLMDLSIVPIMTDWINALHEFLEFGSVKTLITCLDKEKNDKSPENTEYINGVIEEFNDFEYAMNANNLYYLIRGIIYITGSKHISPDQMDIKTLDVNHSAFSPQAGMMLQTIQENYKKRFVTEKMADPNWATTESYILEQIANLYVSQGNYGDAAIAFQEGVLTYIMEQFLKDDIMTSNGFTSREDFYEYVHGFSNREEVKQAYIDELNNHKNKSKSCKRAKTEFDTVYDNIKDKIRNTQAHFKYDKTEGITISKMEKWLTTGIDTVLKEMSSGHHDDAVFKNLTGLKEVYQHTGDSEIQSVPNPKDAIKKLFDSILLKNFRGTYLLAGNLEEALKTAEMREVLSLLNLTAESVVNWGNDLKSYEYNPGSPSDIVRDTYLAWIEKKTDRARRTAKPLPAPDRLTIDEYINQVQNEERLKDIIIKTLQKFSETL